MAKIKNFENRKTVNKNKKHRNKHIEKGQSPKLGELNEDFLEGMYYVTMKQYAETKKIRDTQKILVILFVILSIIFFLTALGFTIKLASIDETNINIIKESVEKSEMKPEKIYINHFTMINEKIAEETKLAETLSKEVVIERYDQKEDNAEEDDEKEIEIEEKNTTPEIIVEKEKSIFDYRNYLNITNNDIHLIMAIARAEGGPDSYLSQYAVSKCILNRALEWKKSIHSVVYQKGQFCSAHDGNMASLSEKDIQTAHDAVYDAIQGVNDPITPLMQEMAKERNLDAEKYVFHGPIYFCSETDGTSQAELRKRSNIKLKAWDKETGLYFYRHWDK